MTGQEIPAMARKYVYMTALELNGIEREIEVSFECPEFELIEDIQVLKIDGEHRQHSVSEDLRQKITDILVYEHEDRMIQEAIEADAETWYADQDARDEAKAERAGWRV